MRLVVTTGAGALDGTVCGLMALVLLEIFD